MKKFILQLGSAKGNRTPVTGMRILRPASRRWRHGWGGRIRTLMPKGDLLLSHTKLPGLDSNQD